MNFKGGGKRGTRIASPFVKGRLRGFLIGIKGGEVKMATDTKSLKNKIHEIGREMVDCKQQCEGIRNELKNGIIPRCLVLEEGVNNNGIIIIGMNPSNTKSRLREQEQEALKNVPACEHYDQWVKFWKNNIHSNFL